jgi:lauroyl/myristoyl acyltransferase
MNNTSYHYKFSEKIYKFILAVISWSYYLIPFPMKKIIGFSLGKFFSLINYRKKVLASNLDLVFPGDDFKKKLLKKISLREIILTWET